MTAPPSPATVHEALARLESAARFELLQLAGALPIPGTPVDPMLAYLAWDLGLPGGDVALD